MTFGYFLPITPREMPFNLDIIASPDRSGDQTKPSAASTDSHDDRHGDEQNG